MSFAKIVAILGVMFLVYLGMTYQSREHLSAVTTEAHAAEQNVAVYAHSVAAYAEANPAATMAPTDGQLALPSGYLKHPGLMPYVAIGNAYVYAVPGGVYDPKAMLRQAGAAGRRIGIKAGTTAKDATGTVVGGQLVPLPGAIPDGSAVYIAREKLPAPDLPPSSPTAAQPPAVPPITIAGSPINPVVATPENPHPVAWTCCTTPGVPVPPPAPAQPPVNPPPALPAAITGFYVGINGGYDSVDGPKPGMKQCKQGGFNTFVTWSANQGNPGTYYLLTIARAGLQLSKRIENSQIQCAVTCAGSGAVFSSAEAMGLVPEISWARLVYDHAMQVGSGITIYPWMMDASVTLQTCNGNGCSASSSASANVGVFSDGQHDCTGGSYPATAHP